MVVFSAPAADTAAASPAGPAPITATSLRSRSVTTDPVYGTRTRPPKAGFLGVRFPLARSGAALHNEGSDWRIPRFRALLPGCRKPQLPLRWLVHHRRQDHRHLLPAELPYTGPPTWLAPSLLPLTTNRPPRT